jgi:hypothetical protein
LGREISHKICAAPFGAQAKQILGVGVGPESKLQRERIAAQDAEQARERFKFALLIC